MSRSIKSWCIRSIREQCKQWGEVTGLQRDHVDLRRGVITIDPDYGALHESAAHGLWLGPPKTPASARTITLPPFLIELLREHLATTDNPFVFTTRTGRPIRRSTFDRRVFRPAADSDARRRLPAVRPGLTFHGLRHSHKTWLIADHIPEIAQAHRLGHHLANRLVEDTRPRNRRSGEHAHHRSTTAEICGAAGHRPASHESIIHSGHERSPGLLQPCATA